MSPSSPTPTEIAEAVERLELLAKACTLSGFDSLPIVSRQNAGPFAADIRTLLAAYTARGEALEMAAVWFDEYAEHHAAKPDPEKARRNRDRAAACRLNLQPPYSVTQDPNQ